MFARHIQHLTGADKNVDITPNFPSIFQLQNLHSLDIFMNRQGRLLLRHVKYLRILCLADTGLELLPKSIARLKCLKFLDLACNPVTVLPEWITELYNLQSLYLFGCKYLSDLPRGLGNLVNLQHFGLSFNYCPAEGLIRQLSHLQILPALQLSEGGFQIVELENLHHIKRGYLSIKGLQLVKSKQDAEKAHLSSKLRVEYLSLVWDNEDNHTNHDEILKALHPNPHLKKLLIKGTPKCCTPSKNSTC
ncbi:putative disease resistance protein RGA1 [Amaranthus tricolor]|uniref:putative disease resistance protein RGA1 n=1 Tax=Amaranthus tricolor TaxID=29722 RepID=UPI00258F3AA2|nr:putative disease resistance protein RGA1 [Amaranthus tricolor]